jgi:hypothetical protein
MNDMRTLAVTKDLDAVTARLQQLRREIRFAPDFRLNTAWLDDRKSARDVLVAQQARLMAELAAAN